MTNLGGWGKRFDRDFSDISRLCEGRGIRRGRVRKNRRTRGNMDIVAVVLVVRTVDVEKVVSDTGHGVDGNRRTYLNTISGVTLFSTNVVVFFPKVF